MKKIVLLLLSLTLANLVNAQIKTSTASGEKGIILGSKTTIEYDAADNPLVAKVAGVLADDVKRVTGARPKLTTKESHASNLILVGTMGHSAVIDKLISEGKIDASSLKDGWEKYIVRLVENPMAGVQRALVIVGSDRRGAAYGMFEVSEAIGVSPLYWFSDVPVKAQKNLCITSAEITSREPAVKYRGIFINDEGWGITPWAGKTFDTKLGDIGPKTYDKVCEFILRMKGNMLAPAMHPSSGAFNKYPENKVVADSWGIVMTSSHCEPLLFNNVTEWDLKRDGEWNYITNREGIMKVLDKRISENGPYENVYTLAMRGIHDAGLVGVPKEREVSLVEEVLTDQRGILSKYIDTPIEKIPQIFVPYKEVQKIYQKGLKVPDDVTLVWPDDNYGYLKQLSNAKEQQRSGGAGVYYHISYLGSPHDYLWINTTPPALMYEELKKAYDTNGRRYWLLNVGDIKPGELGIYTFMQMAWDMDNYSFDRANDSQAQLLAKLYGEQYLNDFRDILKSYYKLGFQHKPEHMGWGYEWNTREHGYERLTDTEFSFQNYNEAQDRMAEYTRIANRTQQIYESLPAASQPSFFELLLYPVKGASMINRKMLLAQLNRQYAREGRASTNETATLAHLCHDSIDYYTNIYNTQLNGKWNEMMRLAPGWCAHYMEMPRIDSISLPQQGQIRIAFDGQNGTLSQTTMPQLPCLNPFTNRQSWFELYNTGDEPIKWQVIGHEPWIQLNIENGEIKGQQRVNVCIDWSKAPQEENPIGTIQLQCGKEKQQIFVPIFNPSNEIKSQLKGLYVEENGVISMPAAKYSSLTERNGIKFNVIEGLGYDGACLQMGQATDPKQNTYDAENRSFADYDFYCFDAGTVTIHTYALPTFAIDTDHGTRFGVMIDDGLLKNVSNTAIEYSDEWQENVYHNCVHKTITLAIDKPGRHTLHLICQDPGVVLQKTVIDFGGLKPSFLGPKSTQNKL